MKKALSILCSIMLLFTSLLIMPMASERTPVYTRSSWAGNLGSWGGWLNLSQPGDTLPQGVRIEGENGANSAFLLTGGSSDGGFQFCLNDGNGFGGINADGYKGFIDATEVVVRYKSSRSFAATFEGSWRVGTRVDLETAKYNLPASPEEWREEIIPLKALEKIEYGTNKHKWVYNMCAARSGSTYYPALVLKFHGISPDDSITFSQLKVNWYTEDMVYEVIGVEGYKEEYVHNEESFDKTKGIVKVRRGGPDGAIEEIPFDDARVDFSGFSNKELTDSLKITATVLNKAVDFNVKVVPFDEAGMTHISIPETTRREYWEKDNFDILDGSIIAHFENGSAKTIPMRNTHINIFGFNSSVPVEQQTIKVYYGYRCFAEYDIKIKEFKFDGEIDIVDAKRLYKVGEPFDWHSGTIKAPECGRDGRLTSIFANVDLSEFDTTEVGENKRITVHYGGLTTEYFVDVVSADTHIPVKYVIEQTMQPNSRPVLWRWPDNGPSFTFIDGAAEDSISPAISVKGDGMHGGGGAFAFITNNDGAGTHNMSDGKVIEGLNGLDAIQLRMKNKFITEGQSKPPDQYLQYAPHTQIRTEYNDSLYGTNKSSRTISFPITGDEWDDVILPIDQFKGPNGPTYTLEEARIYDWLYTMKANLINGKYSPDIQLRFNGKVEKGSEFLISGIKFLWYEKQPVASISISEDTIKKYNVGDNLDLTQKNVTINYKDGSTRLVGLNDCQISGFDSTKTAKGQAVTVSYVDKSASFTVDIVQPVVSEYQYYILQGEGDEAEFVPCDSVTGGSIHKLSALISGNLLARDEQLLMIVAEYESEQEHQFTAIKSITPIDVTVGEEAKTVYTAQFEALQNKRYKLFVITDDYEPMMDIPLYFNTL